MIGLRNFVICVLAPLALAATGCQVATKTPYHYKLTVDIETPQGVKSGYSIIAVNTFSPLKGTEALGGSGPTARGEAVAVDLPNGQTLFALLRSENDFDWAGSAHIRANPKKSDGFATLDEYYGAVRADRDMYRIKRWVGFPQEDQDNYPLLVTFKDIRDPASVVRVNPDDLSARFGPSYRLKAITVQGTDDPVTTGIEKRLGWLPSVYRMLKGGDFKPDGIPVGDFQGLFSTEISD